MCSHHDGCRGHHGGPGGHDGCHGPHCGHQGFRRQYLTKDEIAERLERYLAELKAETTAVEERLAELKS